MCADSVSSNNNTEVPLTFGRLLKQCLKDMNLKASRFARIANFSNVTLSMIVNENTIPTRRWVNEKEILEILQSQNRQVFETYKINFENAITQLPKGGPTKLDQTAPLSTQWLHAVGNFINTVLEHNGDEIADIVNGCETEKSVRKKITDRFFLTPENWQNICNKQTADNINCRRLKTAFDIVSELYYAPVAIGNVRQSYLETMAILSAKQARGHNKI